MKRILAIPLLIIIASCTKESIDKQQTAQEFSYSGKYTVYHTNITYNTPRIWNDKFPGEITEQKDTLFFTVTLPSDSLPGYITGTYGFVKKDSGYLASYGNVFSEVETHGQIVAADTILIVSSYIGLNSMLQTWIRNK